MGKYHAVQEKHWRMWEKAEDFEKAAEILEQISKVCEEKGDGQKKKEATSALIRMLSNPSTIDGLSNALLSVLRSALEASVVSDGNDASVQNQVCIMPHLFVFDCLIALQNARLSDILEC